MARIYNFNAGPAAMPLAVLERAQTELLDLGGFGMSVMEMSHRSKEFQAIADAAVKTRSYNEADFSAWPRLRVWVIV